jgi:acetyl esterase/lipase
MGAFEKMAHDRIESVAEFQAITDAEKPLQSIKFLKIEPTETEPWRGIMLKNTPGQAPAGAPVFIAQGTTDTTVRPEITKQFGEALCKQGARVDFIWLKGVSHIFVARDSARQTLAWIGDRFRGAPAPSSCR